MFKTVRQFSLRDLDSLVEKTYGRPYSFQQQDGCKERGVEYVQITEDPPEDEYDNDEIPEVINGNQMGVSFEAWLKRDPKAPVGSRSKDWEIRMFWERNFYPHIDMVLHDLYKRGILELGEYQIAIDW